ncbi:MAG: cyclic nucleotide-binding domain-containing protein [Bradyrhizobium sp.]|nr:cyclic nucleotide-binding domain-containing protein [Bradyrhizobium sp.]
MKKIGSLSSADMGRLANLKPFAGMETPALEAMLRDAAEWHAEAGERIAEAGRPQPALCLLLEGELSKEPEGDKLPLGTLLGAASLLENRCWPASLTARSPLRLAMLESSALRRACCDLGADIERFAALRPVVCQQRHLSQALRESAVFSNMETPLLRDLETVMTLRTVEGGDCLLREREPADSLLIVVSGRLRARRSLPDGGICNLKEIGPGESGGEVGMILRQPRSADIIAVRDSIVAMLHRASFERLLARHPVSLNRAMAQVIFQYARGKPLPSRHTARTLAVVPLHEGAAANLARRLYETLSTSGRARLLTPAEGRALHADGETAAIGRLSDLEHGCDYLIYEAEAKDTPWTRRAARQADHVLLAAAAREEPGERPIERILAAEPGFALVRKSLVLLHHADNYQPEAGERWRAGRELERIYPLREGGKEIERLARFLSDRAVGVVLGGGGARGFAHLGVLRALTEAGIPVDIMGGNSIGALIGAQFALGIPLEEITRWTRRFVLGGELPVLPLISLLAGRRLERDLRQRFGDTAIETMWPPCFAVSCNLSRARVMVHDEGPLWRALLASNSPAGLLPPVLHEGDLLVDGALLDNVPVGVMREKIGLGPLIAVDVDVREELSVDPTLTRLSGWQALKQRFSRSNDRQRLPGIVDLITRASHIGGLSRRERQFEMADRYLQPPVSGFPMISYRRAEEIAEVGYRYAVERISDWDPLPGNEWQPFSRPQPDIRP